MTRHDFAFPFRIDPASRQAAQTNYDAHVEQMIRQVLLTSPGERADLPEFGCGLRQLIFAPHSEALTATTQMLVQQVLDRWLAPDHRSFTVRTGDGIYILRNDVTSGGWELTMFERGANPHAESA